MQIITGVWHSENYKITQSLERCLINQNAAYNNKGR